MPGSPGRYDFLLTLTPQQAERVRELATWFNSPSVEVAELGAPGMNLRQILRDRILEHFFSLIYQRSVEPVTGQLLVPRIPEPDDLTVVRLRTADGELRELPVSEASFEFGGAWDAGGESVVLRTMQGEVVARIHDPREHYEHRHLAFDPPSFTCPRCGAESWHPEDVRQGYCGRCRDWTGTSYSAEYEDDLDASSRLAEVEDTLAEAYEWERRWQSDASTPVGQVTDTRSLIEAARAYAERDPGDPDTPDAAGRRVHQLPPLSTSEHAQGGWVRCGGPGSCWFCESS